MQSWLQYILRCCCFLWSVSITVVIRKLFYPFHIQGYDTYGSIVIRFANMPPNAKLYLIVRVHLSDSSPPPSIPLINAKSRPYRQSRSSDIDFKTFRGLAFVLKTKARSSYLTTIWGRHRGQVRGTNTQRCKRRECRRSEASIGWRCSVLPRILGNEGYGVCSAFPKGEKHDKICIVLGCHNWSIPETWGKC